MHPCTLVALLVLVAMSQKLITKSGKRAKRHPETLKGNCHFKIQGKKARDLRPSPCCERTWTMAKHVAGSSMHPGGLEGSGGEEQQEKGCSHQGREVRQSGQPTAHGYTG